jgi:Raf kinase inhibitor-like YbhB/YbcL family protein
MRRSAYLIGLSLSLIAGHAALARVEAGDTTALAMDRILSPSVQPLYVTLPSVQQGQEIPALYTNAGKDVSPPVTWDSPPPGVVSYVVIMQDADAQANGPALHWLAYNIPATAEGLNKNVRNRPEAKSPAGMLQGVNYLGGVGYVGPQAHAGDPPHHYHLQVFALDRTLKLGPGASLDKVIAAMNQRVLAEGEVVATYSAPPISNASN